MHWKIVVLGAALLAALVVTTLESRWQAEAFVVLIVVAARVIHVLLHVDNALAGPAQRRILACGVALMVALAAAAALDARRQAEAFVGLLGLASFAYVAALVLIGRLGDRDTHRPAARRALAACLLLALAWRIVLLGAAPLVSDDVYRYVWDGRVQQHGLDPFRTAPADPALSRLHTDVTRRIDPVNAALPSIYPPLAQRYFLGVTWLHESVLAMVLATLACDLLIVGFTWRWLAAAGRSPWWVLAYAWHPLVALEGAGGGHVDIVGTLLLVGAAYALSRRRSLLAAVAFAGAFAVKFLPAVLAPLLWKRIRLVDATVGGLLVLLLYLPFADGWQLPVGSLGTYLAQWRFNGPLFRGLAWATGTAPAIGLALAIGLAAAVHARRTRDRDDPAAWAWPLAATLVLLPTIYPWYLVWLIPFLGPAVNWPLIVWTLASMLTYTVWTPHLAGEGWVLPVWVEPVEYGLVAAAAGWTWWAARPPKASAAAAAVDNGLAGGRP
jgi:hypothetical protein